MTFHLSRLTRLATGLAVLMIWPITAHGQSSRDPYKNALKAVEIQDWQTAIQLLRQSIEEQPTAKAGTFKKYIPHYYLGLSLYELGNCKSALTVWARSKEQGVITRLKEYRTLKHGVEICKKQVARQQISSELAEVTGFATALQQLRSQPELAEPWQTGDPSWDQRYATATQQLESARSILEQSDSRVSMGDLERAREQVQSAARQLDVVQSEARGRLGELQAKRQVQAEVDVMLRLLIELKEDARQVLDDTAYLDPFPPRLGELRAEVELLLVEADKSGESLQPHEIDGLRMALSGALERFKQASSGPPDTLVAGANAFFSADYKRVLEILDGMKLPSGRQSAHAQLFRAASLYSLWVATDEQDETLRAEASSAVQSCRAEDITLVPLSEAFSPRFVDFFFSEGQVRAPIPLDQE